MSDDRYDRFSERHARLAEPSLSETIDLAVRRIMTGLVIAGGLIGLGVYASGDEAPNYQVTTAADGRIIRLNMENGTIISCANERCAIVLRPGQRLEDPEDEEKGEEPANVAVPAPAAQPALPAPTPEAQPTQPAPQQPEPAAPAIAD